MTWPERATPPELAARYLEHGHWDDRTLGQLLDGYLRAEPDLEFRLWSDTRPYRGTYRSVHEMSSRVAAGLQARGVKPGDVVAFQMPNWVEAAATFWGLSLLGAVIVPIVHFYGPKEVAFILQRVGCAGAPERGSLRALRLPGVTRRSAADHAWRRRGLRRR